jgi:hypothetical protein
MQPIVPGLGTYESSRNVTIAVMSQGKLLDPSSVYEVAGWKLQGSAASVAVACQTDPIPCILSLLSHV